MLNNYLKQVQRLIHDQRQALVEPEDLIDYINIARREVAMRTQSVRILTPIYGSIMSASVTAGGSGYTAPTVTITPPDFPSGKQPYPNGAQATAIATQVGGVIENIGITFGGAGYFQPQITINDPHGTGAAATLALSPINQLNQGQEEYAFSAIDLGSSPGVEAIFMVKSVSIIYSNYRYSLPCYSFSTYQALIRQYPFQYQWVPTVCCQRGQGTSGTFMVYPLPSQVYQIEYDGFGIPRDLTDDTDFEVIPQPWTDGVPFLAAYYAYMGDLQNPNMARFHSDEFDKWMHRYSGYARPGRRVNPYGRWAVPLLFILSASVHFLSSALGLFA